MKDAVVVVNAYVAIVAGGHGKLKLCKPVATGCVPCTAGSVLKWIYAYPRISTQLLPYPGQ